MTREQEGSNPTTVQAASKHVTDAATSDAAAFYKHSTAEGHKGLTLKGRCVCPRASAHRLITRMKQASDPTCDSMAGIARAAGLDIGASS